MFSAKRADLGGQADAKGWHFLGDRCTLRLKEGKAASSTSLAVFVLSKRTKTLHLTDAHNSCLSYNQNTCFRVKSTGFLSTRDTDFGFLFWFVSTANVTSTGWALAGGKLRDAELFLSSFFANPIQWAQQTFSKTLSHLGLGRQASAY